MAIHCDKIFHSSFFPFFPSVDVLILLRTSFPESGIFLSSSDPSGLLGDLGLSRKSGALCKRQGAVEKKKKK